MSPSSKLRSDSCWAATGLAGLGLPEPPGGLGPQVVDLGDGRYGTRGGAPALRGLGWFALESERRDPPDYVLAGVEEAATGRPALHYVVSHDRLVCAVQVRVELDDEGAMQLPPHGRGVLDGVRLLQELWATRSPTGRLAAPGRLIVVEAAFGTRLWRWSGSPPQEGEDGLAGALSFVAEATEGAGRKATE